MKPKKIPSLIFYMLFIMYEEMIFSTFVFHTAEGLIYKLLFSIPVGVALYIISSILKNKTNTIISHILVFLTCFIFGAQVIYFNVFENIFSVFSMLHGMQVFQFAKIILQEMLDNWYIILLQFVPFITLIILRKKEKIVFKQKKVKAILGKIVFAVVIHFFTILLILLSPNKQEFSSKNIYYNMNSLVFTARRFGISTAMRLDLKKQTFGYKEKIEDLKQEEIQPITVEKQKEYNMIDIDFDTLIGNETDEEIKEMHEYFKNQEPTRVNEYTGMFKDKNLIVFVAEAFSQMAIRKDITPTLYRLYNEGFQFDNFYTPIFPVSTADGEYVADTGLIPKEGVWSLSRIEGNYMPYSYANVFEKIGYSSNAYHNHTSTYYDRDKYLKTMGYNSYLAKGTGLEERMDCSNWPNSDYEMIKATTDDYINNEHFVAYYMTVSGHMYYTKTGNMMAYWNWDEVKDLPYSEAAKCYLACNIELDKAIKELIDRLEVAGKLEDTVIAITADHYPYGLTLEEINEISTYERDDRYEKYHMPFLLWSGSMKEPIKIDKIGSSLDQLPTILNLFGIDYDSRLIIGKDILSDAEPLVIFQNRNYITDKGRYNAGTGKFTQNDPNEDLGDGYVKRHNSMVASKYKMSRIILEKDYYNIIRNQID